MKLHSQNKNQLYILYLEQLTKIENIEKERKIYIFENIKFYFSDINYRIPEKLLFHIEIPEHLIFDIENEIQVIPVMHYLLKYFSKIINNFNKDNLNFNKNIREKSNIEAQEVSEIIVERNGISYNAHNKTFILNVIYTFPLISNVLVNAKSSFKYIKSILNIINNECGAFKINNDLKTKVNTYEKQEFIRNYLLLNDYVSFIGNGSILPRKNGTNQPLENCIEFISPKENEIVIQLKDGIKITGMGIKKGITVLTGGGYSGKTTLLEAIQFGVYNHEEGDGREFCITIDSAVKIQAEDGRSICNTNLTPFFKYIGLEEDVSCFSTDNASGSVSQATNIIDAINVNCKLLLIDEDKSATNFMIKDDNMRIIVEDDPIIPFCDRIQELYENYDISTILVIGGSSIYIKYADEVIIMDKFAPKNITKKCNEIVNKSTNLRMDYGKFIQTKMISTIGNEFIYFDVVKNENNKFIIIGDYKADITDLTTILTDYQINYLAHLLQLILSRTDYHNKNILDILRYYLIDLKKETIYQFVNANNVNINYWFEDLRVYEIVFALLRLRGLNIKLVDTD